MLDPDIGESTGAELLELLLCGLGSFSFSMTTVVSVRARPLASMLNVTAVLGFTSFVSGIAGKFVLLPCFVGDNL